MDASHQRWLRTTILLGVVYLVIGIAFGALANAAASHQMLVTWRLAAWIASAVVFAVHVGHELLRMGNSPRTTAIHASAAVALGAFGLAVAANVHAHWAAAGNQRLFTLALVAWPVLCGVPAFAVALAAGAGLALARRSHR